MIWILVAHRSDARLFGTSGPISDIRLLREFDYPEGRRQNREIQSDTKGSRYSASAARHGLDPQLEASEHLTDIFAKELAKYLRNGRARNEYDETILVAEPGFLGKLRKFLDKETSRKVKATFNTNMSSYPLPELVKHLRKVVHTTRRIA